MLRILKTLILIFCSNSIAAQTDYSQLINWFFHPDKAINIIGDYNLDIAIIDANLNINSTITTLNNSETNTGIDVFWVHPTELTNPPTNPTTIPLSEQPSSLILSTILAQGGLLAKYGRFFAPRYQQASPASFLDSNYPDSIRGAALVTAYKDVKAAFENYLNNHNNGNKIILAGHSQGSFLLGMLLRDVFDNDPELRSKLLTACLGGKAYYHAEIGSYSEGQWENIPLCTTMNQCECIHTWRSFKETQQFPFLFTTFPIFNTSLVDYGLVYRNVNLDNDWFVQDSLYYNSTSAPLRYYIAPDANYNLGGGANYIAFDSLYTARFKRTNNTKLGLAINYTTDLSDQRPNDLLDVENSAGFALSGFHIKDYHIYIWALMQQIDAKINGCSMLTNIETLPDTEPHFTVYPNPNNGTFTIEMKTPISKDEYILIMDIFGRIVAKIEGEPYNQIQLDHSGVYFLISKYGRKKIIVK